MATHVTEPDTSTGDDRPAPSTPEKRDRFSAWYFPDFEGPDLSEQVAPGQHESLKLLDTMTIAEIFSEPDGDDDQLDEDIPDVDTADGDVAAAPELDA